VVGMHRDEYVRILDYLPRGKSEVPPHKRKPIAQAVGEDFFSLLEIVPRANVSLKTGERVYIGEGTRDKVDHIERRIKYDWLTPNAKVELELILADIIRDHEEKFINFYNTTGTISTRLHKLEVLPRIGKRHREDILREREKMPFKSFKDMRDRVKNMPDPVKVLVDKIIQELKGESKYQFFVPLIRESAKVRR